MGGSPGVAGAGIAGVGMGHGMSNVGMNNQGVFGGHSTHAQNNQGNFGGYGPGYAGQPGISATGQSGVNSYGGGVANVAANGSGFNGVGVAAPGTGFNGTSVAGNANNNAGVQGAGANAGVGAGLGGGFSGGFGGAVGPHGPGPQAQPPVWRDASLVNRALGKVQAMAPDSAFAENLTPLRLGQMLARSNGDPSAVLQSVVNRAMTQQGGPARQPGWVDRIGAGLFQGAPDLSSKQRNQALFGMLKGPKKGGK